MLKSPPTWRNRNNLDEGQDSSSDLEFSKEEIEDSSRNRDSQNASSDRLEPRTSDQ